MLSKDEQKTFRNPFARAGFVRGRLASWHQQSCSHVIVVSLSVIAVFFSLVEFATAQTGRVVNVHDGDTITILTADKKQLKIRMAGIDAPELKQDFGHKAKENLSKLVFGKIVTLEGAKTDRYGRLIRKVLVNSADANLEQVKAGFAWHYKEYKNEQPKTDRETYATADDNARSSGLGLWSMPHARAPWEFRRSPHVDQRLRGKIIGNKNKRIYHWEGCPGFAKVSERNRALFSSVRDAEAAGYRAAKGCSTNKPAI